MQQISSEDCRLRFPVFPEYGCDPISDEETYHFPETIANAAFILEASSFSRLALKAGKALAAALASLGADSLVFLGDNKIPWRRRDVSCPPARRGLEYLEVKGIGRRFNGGLQFGVDELPVAMRHLLWLVRTNTFLPYLWFTEPAQRFIASPCQYGGLHLSILAGQDANAILKAFSENGFLQVDASSCNERFSKGGIRGRTIPV
jgi:hypothetical protein